MASPMSSIDDNTMGDEITINKKTGTVITLDTKKKYVKKDIALTLNVKTGSVTLAADAITANPTLSFSNNQLVASYSGSTTVTPTVAAGWVASVNSLNVSASGQKKVSSLTISKGNNFTILTAANSSADSSVLTVTNNTNRHLTLTNDGIIDSITNNGTFTELTNNSSKTIDNIYNSGTITVTSGGTSAGTLKVNAYNGSTLSGAKTIVSGGKWSETSVSASGTYYGKVTVGTGDYTPSVVEHSITTAPKVTGALSGKITTIGTTTKPSGTDGTDYWSVTPSTSSTVTVGKSSVKAKATINTAGYIAEGDKTTATADVIDITPSRANGTTRYLVKAAGSVTMTAGNGTCTYSSASNATISNSSTDPGSGVSVTFKGKGAVSATAKITTAGYTPTNNSFATGASTNSNEASLTKYITGVTLQKSTSNRTFDITVPNGSSTVKFTFTVDTNGNVVVT